MFVAVKALRGIAGLLLLLLMVGAQATELPSIHARNYSGVPGLSSTNIGSLPEDRGTVAGQLVDKYRRGNSLPPGSPFRVVWGDGSSETMIAHRPLDHAGPQPVSGTQRPAAPGGNGGGGGGPPTNDIGNPGGDPGFGGGSGGGPRSNVNCQVALVIGC